MYVSPCGGEDWASARAIAIRAGTERTQSAAGWTYAASLSRWGDTSTDGPKLGAGFVCVCVGKACFRGMQIPWRRRPGEIRSGKSRKTDTNG